MNEVNSGGIPVDNKPFLFGDKVMNRDIRPESHIYVKLKNQTITELNGTLVALDREMDFNPKYHERLKPEDTEAKEEVVDTPVVEDETEEEEKPKKTVKKVVKKAKK